MKTNLDFIGIVLLTVLTISCNTKEIPKDFDYGTIDNNKYINTFFDLEISLPADWVIQTEEQMKNLSEFGKDLVAGDDKNLKTLIKASEVNTANLLVIYKYELGSTMDINPNFSLVSTNLKNYPGIKTGGDNLNHLVKLLKQSQIIYDHVDEEFKKIVIDDQEFYLATMSFSAMGYHVNQEIYSTIKNGFSITISISYGPNEQKADLDQIINSIKFKK